MDLNKTEREIILLALQQAIARENKILLDLDSLPFRPDGIRESARERQKLLNRYVALQVKLARPEPVPSVAVAISKS
jgi:hypothetical protein